MSKGIVFFSKERWSFSQGVLQTLRQRLCSFAALEELEPFSCPLFAVLVRLLHFLEDRKWTGLAYLTEEFLVPLAYSLVKDVWREQLEEEITQCKPKLLISCVPWMNGLLAEIADKLHIPFVLIPCENDLKNWLYGVQRQHTKNFWLFTNQYMPESFCDALRGGVLESQIFPVGAPIDPMFTGEVCAQGMSLKKKQAPHEKIVAISVTTIEVLRGYLEVLLNWEQRLQIIIFDAGGLFSGSLLQESSNEEEQILLVEGTAWASWLPICDLWISSPSASVLNYAIAARVPVLVDEIGSLAWRDSLNAFFLHEKGLGAGVCSYEDLPFLLATYLYDVEMQAHVQEVFADLKDNLFWDQLDDFLEKACAPPLLSCS